MTTFHPNRKEAQIELQNNLSKVLREKWTRNKVFFWRKLLLMFSNFPNRFCQELEEFWAYQDLLEKFSKRLTFCCEPDLLPLLQLPSVRVARARQLRTAGYERLEKLATATPSEIVKAVPVMSIKAAKGIIDSAKVLVFEKIDSLESSLFDLRNNLWCQ